MIPWIGDFAEDETIYHYFNTFDSNDPAASVTITNLADTDIYVYKDGSVTDIVTDGATVVIDFDSRTGVHKLTIDTSVHADYAIGSDYMVLVEGTTVDAGTVTAGIFTFSIENRYNDVNVVTVSGTAQTANDNGADINDILLDTAEIGTAGAGLTNIGTIATVTTLTGHTAQTGDTYALANGATGFAAIDTVVDGIQTDLSNGTDGLGAIKAETALIVGDTVDIQTQVGTAGAGLTDLGGMSTTMKAQVNTEVVDTLNTDTYAEPGQGAPGGTVTLAAKINYLYKAWRNKSTQTATTYSLYDDAGSTVDQKATVSDDATTATKGEVATGP